MKLFLARMRFAAASLLCAMGVSAVLTMPALAEKNENGIQLVMDCDYTVSKVNDPVSKKSKTAIVVREDPSFHIETARSFVKEVPVLLYRNDYVDGADKGVRCRLVEKNIEVNVSSELIPAEVYDSAKKDGSLYDYMNHCYMLRVYSNEAKSEYQDYYFGVVDDTLFEQMKKTAAQQAEEQKKLLSQYGPALKR